MVTDHARAHFSLKCFVLLSTSMGHEQSDKGAEMKRPMKPVKRRTEQRWFALVAAVFMVCAHRGHFSINAGLADDTTGGPDPGGNDEMPTTVGAAPRWNWCPALFDNPEMPRWPMSLNDRRLAYEVGWCLKAKVAPVREWARKDRRDDRHRQSVRAVGRVPSLRVP